MAAHFPKDYQEPTVGQTPETAVATTGTGTTSSPLKGKVVLASFVVTGLLMLTYLIGVTHFSKHYPPGCTVLGVDASWLDESQLAERLDEVASDYRTVVTGDGISLELTSADLGLKVDGEAVARDVLESYDPWSWVTGLLRQRTFQPDEGITVDAERVTQAVEETVKEFNATAEPPTDAAVVYSDADAAFVIQSDAYGTKVDAAAVASAVEESALHMASTTTLGEAQLARAELTSESPTIIEACERANQMSSITIPLELEGKELIRVTGEQIHSWLDFTKKSDGTVSVSVNEHRCWQWCFDTLNPIVNGENETRVWEVSSPETAKALMPRIAALDTSACEIPTITIETRPEETEGHEARGRHIDVNLSTQYARFYDTDGKTVLWRSGIVSGNPYTGHATPQGEYEIVELEADTILYGPEDPETHEPEYASPVRWWMSFNYTDGFHDADWRWDWEFGTDMYLWDGSHGCINLPIDKAGELWEIIELGDKVYIHE